MTAFINTMDQTLLLFIQTTFHFSILDKIMIFATTLGNQGLIWIIIGLILTIYKRTRIIGIITLAALLAGSITGEGILKHWIQRPRPYSDFPWINLLVDKPTTYSFPSGHTTSSFAAAFVLSRYLKEYSAIFWGIACLIAFSRLYLFLHYPSDIIAGIILGLICGITMSYIFDNRLKGNTRLR